MSCLTCEERRTIQERSVPWTPEQDAAFKRLWADGATIDIIGAATGKSRNSVASRRRRLGLAPRKYVGRARHEAKRQQSRLPQHQRKRGPKYNNPTGLTVARLLTAKTTVLMPEPLPVPAPLPNPVSFQDIGYRQCRYIGERPALLTLDTPIYCGAPTNGGSWCPHHRSIVLRPPIDRPTEATRVAV